MTGHEWSDAINRHACYYMGLNEKCRKTGKPCPKWHKAEDCDDFIHHAEAVCLNYVEPHLRELLKRAAETGSMVYIENEDDFYTDEMLNDMMYCITLQYPILSKSVDINATRKGDYLIVVYQGVGKILATV